MAPKAKTKPRKVEPLPPTGEQICCTACGSFDVQYAVWWSPNTGDTDAEPFGSWNAGDNTFCRDCDIEGRNPNPDLVDFGADPKLWKASRAKWRRAHKRRGAKPHAA